MATNAENIHARDTKVIAAAWRLIAREGVLALTVKGLFADEGVDAEHGRGASVRG
ncbi:MAG: hypothetical protein L0H39_01320 [Brachybacterium sp.]|nr:hypothetical protein [Brachybacterium sp.]MDN5894087.1 hypothetical protein [Nocardioides sp.]